MNKEITESCYRAITDEYCKIGMMRWIFPVEKGYVRTVGESHIPHYFRKMDVETPPHIEHLWEYI